ncbi:MAG: hypothetical protein H0V14_07275 [Chitinophagaceae bacterium]|jgi:hypothetical protein|nr:hypothetical protein [Chitinophagaceae bacterium]
MAFCFTCIYSCASSAQNNYTFLLNKSYPQRFQQIDSIFYNGSDFKDSASFFNKATALSSFAKEHNDKELYMDAEFIKYRYYPNSQVRNNYNGIRNCSMAAP